MYLFKFLLLCNYGITTYHVKHPCALQHPRALCLQVHRIVFTFIDDASICSHSGLKPDEGMTKVQKRIVHVLHICH